MNPGKGVRIGQSRVDLTQPSPRCPRRSACGPASACGPRALRGIAARPGSLPGRLPGPACAPRTWSAWLAWPWGRPPYEVLFSLPLRQYRTRLRPGNTVAASAWKNGPDRPASWRKRPGKRGQIPKTGGRTLTALPPCWRASRLFVFTQVPVAGPGRGHRTRDSYAVNGSARPVPTLIRLPGSRWGLSRLIGMPAPVPEVPPMVERSDIHRALGLTDDEAETIVRLLGRPPNHLELAMYAVMWSEHCSYKSSRVHLKRLPTEGSTRAGWSGGERRRGRCRRRPGGGPANRESQSPVGHRTVSRGGDRRGRDPARHFHHGGPPDRPNGLLAVWAA